MYVISLRAWRRRFGSLIRTLLIAGAVLWVLFALYRWLSPVTPVLDSPPSVPSVEAAAVAGGGQVSHAAVPKFDP